MKLTTLALAAALLALPGTAQAQTLLDGADVDEIVNLARGYGSASLEIQDSGRPMINGRIDGVPYAVYFVNCDDEGNACEDLNFYSGFLDVKPAMDAMNAWNRDKRFGRAYLDSDLDAVIEFDINLEYGVSRDNLDAAFGLWSLLLDQFAVYIGAKN